MSCKLLQGWRCCAVHRVGQGGSRPAYFSRTCECRSAARRRVRGRRSAERLAPVAHNQYPHACGPKQLGCIVSGRHALLHPEHHTSSVYAQQPSALTASAHITIAAAALRRSGLRWRRGRRRATRWRATWMLLTWRPSNCSPSRRALDFGTDHKLASVLDCLDVSLLP